MANFSSEAHMQCEFFSRREKIFPEYFNGYEIYGGDNCEGIEYSCGERKNIDFLLENKSENKLLIVELKNEKNKQGGVKAKLGVLCQIYLYFMELKQRKEFKDKKISVMVIYGDFPSKEDINNLELAILAKGKKMEYIKRNKLEFKAQIEAEYPEYNIEEKEDFEKKKVLLLKHKSKSELLVVCESEGYKGFGQISYLLGREIEKAEKAEYEKISGVVAIINGKAHEEELKLALKENKDTFANIDVKFMTWNKKQLEPAKKP